MSEMAARAEIERLQATNVKLRGAMELLSEGSKRYEPCSDHSGKVNCGGHWECAWCRAERAEAKVERLQARLAEMSERAKHWERETASIASANQRRERLLLKAYTVVEWVCGEGYVLPLPHYDADDLLLEIAAELGCEDKDSAAIRAELGDET